MSTGAVCVGVANITNVSCWHDISIGTTGCAANVAPSMHLNPFMPNGFFHLYQLDQSIPFKGFFGGIFHFNSIFHRAFCKLTVKPIRRRALRRLIWICTVCLCPPKRALGLYGLNNDDINACRRFRWETKKILEKSGKICEPRHKLTKGHEKTPISITIRSVWFKSSLSAWRMVGSSVILRMHSEDLSDLTNIQADLNLRWAHTYCHGMTESCFFLFTARKSRGYSNIKQYSTNQTNVRNLNLNS